MKTKNTTGQRNARLRPTPGDGRLEKKASLKGGMLAKARQLHQAAGRLEAKGLTGRSSESLSIRIPGTGQFLLLAAQPKKPITSVDPAKARLLAIAKGPESGGALSPERLHATIYARRPDAGAIFIGRQTWASALNDLDRPLPPIFDEQVRQLGQTVQRIATENSADGTIETDRALNSGANAYFAGDSTIILGMILDKVIFNAELLEKCARAYILAFLTGGPVLNVPLYVRLIANQRLKKDEARAAACYARGEVPGGFTAY